MINKKEFEFEETIECKEIDLECAKKICKKYYINGEEYKSGFLKIEAFSNNENDILDYDLSIELKINETHYCTFALKTSNKLEAVKDSLDKLLKDFCSKE